MRPITERTQVRRVAAAWAATYADWDHDEEKQAIGKRLAALDPEKATAKDVAEIIGNRSWTHRQCDECGAMHVDLVALGDVRVCEQCLRDALNLIRMVK